VLAPRWVHALAGCGVGMILMATIIWFADADDAGAMAWGFLAVGIVAVAVWTTWVVIAWSRRSSW
jgi:hypothetical protein